MQHSRPFSITFNNTRYHLNGAMEDWCSEHIGPGGWIPGYAGHENDVWSIDSAFGNTTFRFKDTQDLAWFVLKWGA